MSETIFRRVIISGRVQGVGYRDWTRHVARGRGIAGWVRNLRDGSVEALFSGSPESVAGMIAACRNGPSSAIVNRIDEHDADPGEFALRGEKDFAVLPTL